jgi:hypothetical protein
MAQKSFLFFWLKILTDFLPIMGENWVKIHTVSQEYNAEMIKGMLAEHDINCVLVNKKDSSYLIGEIEIYVDVEHAFIAKQILTDQKSE